MPWDLEKNQPYGVFKKILIEPELLKTEAKKLKPELILLYKNYISKKYPDNLIGWNFFYIYYYNRNQNKLFNSNLKKIDFNSDLITFLKQIHFYKLPDTIRQTFIYWLENKWNIRLLNYNPTSYEMLDFQSKGIRIITIDWNSAIKGKLVEGNRDAWEHFLHDLEHCYKFFSDPFQYRKQIKFFIYLKEFYPEIEVFLKIDNQFKIKWEYLISDMNSHIEHLKHYTRAIFYEFFKKYPLDIIKENNKNKILLLLKKIDFKF
ncbi:MAG: hypothetical protein KatS3mg129_2346 [Leptospiraceae bacterium]|nr:MAG: hypothetical protein KatS3mg129_2346 [Leptospiraceae bacterium]